MIKILTIVGARPQIIKASAISRTINNLYKNKIDEIIIHTGQHYDKNMSSVFFDELSIPHPKYNFSVGSGTHGIQTGQMLQSIEKVLLDEKPDAIILYGDTNTTIAGSLAAVKVHYPIIHIEAGLRSFNKTMPEEINRIICDHCSTLLFCPTETAYNNLIEEGFKEKSPPHSIDNPGLFFCGDIMYDNSLYFSDIAQEKSSILKDNNLSPNKYVLVTIHRANNTNDKNRLNAIFSSLVQISKNYKETFVAPLHPRTLKILNHQLDAQLLKEINQDERIKIIPAVSFLDMIMLENNAKMIFTDSGGVQKEAYFFEKPCLILRPETEWIELLKNNCAILTDSDENKIIAGYEFFLNKNDYTFSKIFGKGATAQYICDKIIETFK